MKKLLVGLALLMNLLGGAANAQQVKINNLPVPPQGGVFLLQNDIVAANRSIGGASTTYQMRVNFGAGNCAGNQWAQSINSNGTLGCATIPYSAIVGLGTAATYNIGTSGNNIGALNGVNSWSANQTFLNSVVIGTATGGALGNGTINAQGLYVNGTAVSVGTTAITALTGDVLATGPGSTPATVTQINGVPLGTTTASSGNILIGSGSAWVSKAVSGDCTITSAGVVGCTKLNGVAYGSSPSTNTVPVVTGANTVTYEAVPNVALANSTMTLAGHSVALGGTQTFAASDLTNGTTGTGAVVLAGSPALTGTLAGANATWTGQVAIGTTTQSGVLNVSGTATATTFSGAHTGNGSGLTGIGTSNMTVITGSPSSTTFLRGDGTWGTPSGGGSGTVSTGTAGYAAYYQSNGTTVVGTSALQIVGGKVGIGTATPGGLFTVGNNVFEVASTGHVLIEGVTSTGATGTGNFVFSASPTFSGTTVIPAISSSGNLLVENGTGGNGEFQIWGNATTGAGGQLAIASYSVSNPGNNFGGTLFLNRSCSNTVGTGAQCTTNDEVFDVIGGSTDSSNSGSFPYAVQEIEGVFDGIPVSTSTPGALHLWTTPVGQTFPVAGNGITIKSTGNVGIGTATPASKLDVYGAININGVNAISFPTDASTVGGSINIGNGAGVSIGSSTAADTIAIGYQSLTTAAPTTLNTQSVAIGYQAGLRMTSGINNDLIGWKAGLNMTTAFYNDCMGHDACGGVSIGTGNVGVGEGVLYGNDGAAHSGISGNTAIGNVALFQTTTYDNTALGYGALYSDSTGAYNLGLGYQAGGAITTGQYNVVIGLNAGNSTLSTGSNNILIGQGIDAAANAQNTLNIGGEIFGNNVQSYTGVGSGIGIGTATIANALDVNGNASIGYKNTAAPSNGLIVSGNVGIGTSNPISSTLSVNGDTALTGYGESIAVGTATTTWTSPAYTTASTSFKVTVIGGGGNGAIASSTTTMGGGGGSGGACIRYYTGLTASHAYTIAVGAAGANSTFSDGTTTLTGGAGTNGGTTGQGGAVGSCTNQTYYAYAENGETGAVVTGTAGSAGGNGGGNIYGRGGLGSTTTTGGSGTGCGGGGGGTKNGQTAGSGAIGCVLVEWIH